MMKLTRRNLLKTGLAATAGLLASDKIFADLNVETATPASESLPELPAAGTELGTLKSSREVLLLDFGWRFHLGNANDAAQDFRWGAPVREGAFAKAGQAWIHNKKDNALQHSFDDSAWRVLDLPHDWVVELPFIMPEGPDGFVHAAHGSKPLGREYSETSIGWYDRTFEIPASDVGRRISIDFDGVFRDAIIFLNGFYLGRHLSGYAPFSLDITDYVKYGGKNVITVRVDATLNEGWYYEGAGIYRHVWLRKTHPLHIAKWGTFVQSEVRGKGALVSIGTELMNESDAALKGRVLSAILDAEGKLVATVPPKSFEIAAHDTLTMQTQVTVAHAALWSVEEPNLYRVVSQVETGGEVIDHDNATFGVRSIHFDPDRGFFLNGKPVKIKGTCVHQDHAGLGIAVPDRIHFERVTALKAMGANGWRTAHNQVATGLLDACDRQGMMVMAESRMMASTPEGLSQLEAMIRQSRNHPCIVIWSLANEEYFYQGTPTGARIVSTMKRLVKKMDPTRPVTAAMNCGWVKEGVSSVVDVQGFNYWNGELPDEKVNKKGRLLAADVDRFHKEFPHLPCIGTEISNGNGTRGIYVDNPARGHTRLSNAAAEEWWKIYDERPFLSGGFAWSGIDYRGEPGPYDLVSVNAQSGILDTCCFPKDIFYYYKSWWSSEPVLHLFPHWNWAGKEGQAIDVWCYTNLDSVEFFVNGKSLGSKTVERNSHVRWTAIYQPGVIEVQGSKSGKVILTARRETTGASAKLVLRASQIRLVADGQDVSSVTIEVQDAQGRVMPTAGNKLNFKLSGEGKIIGVGNGDPGCQEADKPDSLEAATRSAFNGLCLAIVQATKNAGTIELEAFADGLEPAKILIQSHEVEPAA
ncbi:MAG TPA: beta-galactosidase GalA [Verrucomicrobiae bacterium]|nr:beta-galactosidase GalA [Verrucomicrobiae bacterium]